MPKNWKLPQLLTFDLCTKVDTFSDCIMKGELKRERTNILKMKNEKRNTKKSHKSHRKQTEKDGKKLKYLPNEKVNKVA